MTASAHGDDAADQATAAIAALLQEALVQIRTMAYLGRTIGPEAGPAPDDFRERIRVIADAGHNLPSPPSLTGDRLRYA